MTDITFKKIQSNGINMRLAMSGDSGPMLLLAHGWPESWYSWRHQLTGLAAAGYRVVAPDMRGYGETDAPPEVDDYDMDHLTGDMVGILDALNEPSATIIGHDWGSPVAQFSALYYPQRFTSMVIMSVPYTGHAPRNPLETMRATFADNFFYILYHIEPGGVAERDYDRDPRGILSRLYLSPDSPREAPQITNPKRSAGGGWIPRLGAPKGLPDWLTGEDLDYYVDQFTVSGFRGGLNYYRNIGRNWELMADRTDFVIKVPSMFLAGEKDMVIARASKDALQTRMEPYFTDLRNVVLFPKIGHWVQQEAPGETNNVLLDFLKTLD
ncbi:MAG: alpha/beta hydrolase [Gammaproteobacteria bacterium]|nr:alpha/beta hydrolase [Gammaproteobacteria bacterium]